MPELPQVIGRNRYLELMGLASQIAKLMEGLSAAEVATVLDILEEIPTK